MESHPCDPCHYLNNVRFACIILLLTSLLSWLLFSMIDSIYSQHVKQMSPPVTIWFKSLYSLSSYVSEHAMLSRNVLEHPIDTCTLLFWQSSLVFWGVSRETQKNRQHMKLQIIFQLTKYASLDSHPSKCTKIG